MNKIIKITGLMLATFVLIGLVFPLPSIAQKMAPAPGYYAPITPHDFIGDYYQKYGVIPRYIKWRRTGKDGLSTFDKPQLPQHRDVRITVTVPAYSQAGEPYFWYPLGELTNAAFTGDEMGFMAMQMARLFPMYLFPDEKYTMYNTIVNTRQAPLMDNTMPWWLYMPENPLGLREVFLVNYTEKCSTPEGLKMMEYMGGKNGFDTSGMPLIKSMADMHELYSEGFVTMQYGDAAGPDRGHFAMAPIMDPTKGVIAKDAFLWMSTRDGNPLKGEMMFVDQFKCLQDTGDWCN